jgi:hypothetical protein
MTEDEKRRVKSDVIEAMRIAIEDSLSPVAHVPDNMAIAYKAAEAGFAAGLEALAGPMEPSEPVAFGTGMLVIDTGRFNGAPAVFVADAKIGGPVGTSSEKEGHANNLLQPGEWVLTFPTAEQAQRVADALVNTSLAPATEPSEEEVARVIRGVIGAHIIDQMQARSAAQEVRNVYRSRRNG